MAIYPQDIYNPNSSGNDLLDFVNQARTASGQGQGAGSNIVDPTTGISLADYLLLQKEAGATPSFTNIPGQGSLDNFVVPGTPAPNSTMVNDTNRQAIQLLPNEYNPDTVNDATDASNMIANLETKKKEALLNLEQEKAQELGLYDLRDQILAIKGQPYYSQSEYAQQQVQNLATQYEAKRNQVEAYLNSPNIAKQFLDVDNTISQWKVRENDLTKTENQNRAIDQQYGIRPGETVDQAITEQTNIAGQKTKATNRIKAQQLYPTKEDEQRTMKYAGISDTNELLDRTAAKDDAIISAKWLSDKEKRVGRDLSLTDVIGYAPAPVEGNAVSQVLGKKVRDGEITAGDAQTWQDEVINPTSELAVRDIESETAAYQRKQIEAEIARQNAGKKKEDQITYDRFIADTDKSRITALTKLVPEREAQIRAQAKIKAYRVSINNYKNKLISSSFTDATDLANVPDIPLEVKQENAQLRAKYPEAFVYPTNPNNIEQAKTFINNWRNIIVNDALAINTLQATLNYAVHRINQDNDNKLVDGTSTVLPSNNLLNNLSAYMLLGKLQAGEKTAGIYGAFLSDQTIGERMGMTPEEIAIAESLKGGQ